MSSIDRHHFTATLVWPADANQSLPPAADFSRNNVMAAPGKPPVPGSSPRVFSGDETRYNPEELMLLSLSQCHMLTYLAIAAKKRLTILAYQDTAEATLAMGAHGTAGKMSMQEVVLRPQVTVAPGTDLAEARALHDKAHANCFMANSVNFPVRVEAAMIEQGAA